MSNPKAVLPAIRFTVMCFLFFTAAALLGQSAPQIQVTRANDNLRAKTDAALARLDRSRITTGILHDKVVPLAPIDRFDGKSNDQVGSLRDWQQIYFEMRNSHLDAYQLPSIADLQNQVRALKRENVIPVGIQYFKYNKIKPDAVERGLLRVENEQFVEVAGQNETPYLEKTAFAASAMQTSSRTPGVTFLFSASFFQTNMEKTPQQFEVDFGDGNGFRPVRPGDRIAVNYGTSGSKTLVVRLFDGIQTLRSATKFEVKAPTAAAQVTPDIIWEGEVSSYAYQGAFSTYDGYVFFGNGNSAITKPLVFVEGFDLDNSLEWQDIWDLLNEQNLAPALQSYGYDIVIMNFGDATDYIQGNGLALVTLLEKIMSQQVGSESMVVAGASMGGLVSRYALLWMEDNAIAHNTRLLATFDSPHQGANMPLGDQYFVDFFADYDASIAALVDALNSPAAQQQLVYHHLDAPNIGQNALRQQLLADFAILGEYPSSAGMRRVAVSNGSGAGLSGGQIGNTGVMQPGDLLLDWDYTSFLVDINSQIWAVPDQTPQIKIFHGLVDQIWPLPDDELDVFASGTQPYDNAPGGWSDTQQQVVDQVAAAGMGPISTNFPNHDFIPTVSSLDLKDTNGDPLPLFHDVNSDPNLLAASPFDTVFVPALANEEHVGVTPGNAAFLIRQLLIGDPNVNLALNRMASASAAAPAYPASNTVDGNPTTAWGAQTGGQSQWLMVDLGNVVPIGKARITWAAQYFPTAYQLQTSNDNTNWNTVFSTASGAGGIEEQTFPQTMARYFRVLATSYNANILAVFELEIYSGDAATPPDAPSNLTADAPSSTQIDLAWDDNANNESGFTIERHDGSGIFAEIATVAANISSYNDLSLTPSTTYTYRVLAFNSAGNSSYSNSASATTDTPPAIAYRINPGGNNYTDSNSDVFVADKAYSSGGFGYVGGQAFSFGQSISGTTDDLLYQTVRGGQGAFEYRFDGLPAGSYQVELYFTEPQVTAAGQRLMDIQMEGNLVYDDLDIFAESGGKLFALVKSNVVAVTDGQLNVNFVPVTRPAFVCAIAVIEQSTAKTAQPELIAAAASDAIPENPVLEQNYPNPFNPTTQIRFGIDRDGSVSLRIYNALGEQIRVLAERYMPAGYHSIEWDALDAQGKRVPSGLYLYKLTSSGQTLVRKMLLLK